MFRKLITAAAVAVVAAGGAALGFSQAGANLRTTTYQDVANGTAGYSATNGTPFRNINAVIATTPASLNIGGVGKGGIGVQLCDPNNGFGLQVGITSNGTTFSVDYAYGTLMGAAADHCVGNGVLDMPHVLNPALTALPVGDSVTVYESYRFYVKGNAGVGQGHRFGAAYFQAMDANGFEIFSADVWKLPADRFVNEAGAGIQQDTTGLTGGCAPLVIAGLPVYLTTPPNQTGACKDSADFSGVYANGTGGIGGFAGNGMGPGLANWNVTEVVTSAGGLKANDPIVSANHSLVPTTGAGESTFSVFTS